MKKRNVFWACVWVFLSMISFPLFSAEAADLPDAIVLGVPTSLGTLEGDESHKAVVLAVEEINQQGGVKVGGKGIPFRVEALDIRDSSPGVPVPEALPGIGEDDS